MAELAEQTGGEGAPAIRPARRGDIHAIYELVDAAYDPLVEQLGVPPWHRQFNYLRAVHAGTLWLLHYETRIAGMVGLGGNGNVLSVETVAVSPAYQRRGLGRALIALAEAEARKRNCARLTLFTHERMIDARAFYRHLGFVETREIAHSGHNWVVLDKSVGTKIGRS
jgi:ribosomal protein S18 acetylase RimI-like enzyme